VRNPVSSDPPSPRVAVVGAGFAGLSAAFRLHGWGIPSVVLEARDRVGGRVLTTHLDNGEPAELGAEWIEEHDRAVLGLAEELGLELAATGVDYRRRQAVGALAASDEDQERALEVARAALDGRRGNGANQSLGAFVRSLPLDESQRATLVARLQGTCARDLDQVSLHVAERGTFVGGSGRYLRVAAGNQFIAVETAKRLPDVRLRHVVRRIRAQVDGVHVEGTTRGGGFSLQAPAVVVAVPAPLAAGIRFEPALPLQVGRAIAELPIGDASKLAVATDRVPPLRALQDIATPFWCWTALGGDRPRRVVTAFAGSPEAQSNLATTSGDVGVWPRRLAEINADLLLEGEPVLATWGDDPFARGCYSCFDDTSWDRMPLLSAPVGRVAFAGEHTAGLSSGTMNGAVESGNRTASWARDLLAAPS
jgi:monoamine oxidase